MMGNRDFAFRQEVSKPTAPGATLLRLWRRFRAYSHLLLGVAILIVISRITNDADTIQQAIGFPLVSVIQGSLLIVWIAYNMLVKSPAYAVVSLSIVPVMYLATSWFSARAREAYRKVLTSVGDVNAN